MEKGRENIIPAIFVSRGSIVYRSGVLHLLLSPAYVCVPGVGRGGGVGQVGAAPANQRGEADDEADDPDQADQ